MDFDLSEDQREIQAVARELLAARSSWPRVREAATAGAYDAALWREICDLGWPGIAVSERFGGQGLGIVELAVLCEELGAACTAVPFLSTVVAAAAIDRYASDGDRERWLPELVSGAVRAAVGRPGLLVDGAGASVAVVLETAGGAVGGVAGTAVRLVTDLAASELVTIDPTRRFATLASGSALPGATVDPGASDAPGPAAVAGAALDPAAGSLMLLAVAAEVVGVCRRALEMTLEYVRERRQFGVPVGSFQAVGHRCAEMLLHAESARSGAYYAAWAADADPELLPEAAALAAAAAATGGREVTASAIQAHGGIGFTWEADVHWLYKRAEVDRALLGGPGAHHAALARAAAARAVA